MTKAAELFTKLALKVKEINTMEGLYEDSPNMFHRVVAMRDEAPQAAIGLRWKKKDGTSRIFVDPETTAEKQRSIRRHELVHDIRERKGKTSAKWANRETGGIRKGLGVLIEESAATRAGSYSRTMANSPLGRKVSNKYLYPLESGIGAAIGKRVRFNTIRKLLAKK